MRMPGRSSIRNPSETFGVGIVFEVNPRDASVRIVDIDAMCSAGRAGVILVREPPDDSTSSRVFSRDEQQAA